MVEKRINNYLIINGISLDDLSIRSGVSRSMISDICSGKCKVDCIDYYKICRALDVDLELFLK